MTHYPPDPASTDPGMVRLQEGFPLSRDDCPALEEGLARILVRPGYPWNDRLVAGEVFLGMLAEYLRATASRENEETRTGTLRHYVDRMTEDSNERLFQIAKKTRPNRHVRRLVLGLFHAFDCPGKREPGGKLMGLRTTVRLLPGLVPLPRASRSLPAPGEDEAAVLMDSLLASISRGGLLDGPPPYFTGVVRRGYAHLLITAALILSEWGGGGPSPSRRDSLADAIRIVQGKFGPWEEEPPGVTPQERISRSRLALHLLDSCIHRKDFARSMVGP